MLKDYLPLFGIALTAFLGVLTYAIQEDRKRKAALDERRQLLYEKLIRDLVDLLIATTGTERSKLITEIEKGWLFASDQVLDACYEFLKIYDRLCHEKSPGESATSVEIIARVRSDQKLRDEIAQSLAKIFLTMRLDVRRDTKIDSDWAQQHFQIYDWGAIAAPDVADQKRISIPLPW
jgi:hypothetical protein